MKCVGKYTSTTSVLQRDAIVGRQTGAGTRVGNQQRHTHRRVTSAHQRRPTTPNNGKQLNTPTSYNRQPACQGAEHASFMKLHRQGEKAARFDFSRVQTEHIAPLLCTAPCHIVSAHHLESFRIYRNVVLYIA